MKKRSLLFIVSVLVLSLGLAACGKQEEKKPEEPKQEQTDKRDEGQEHADGEMKIFTLEELAKYNGKDGAKAYIAVDGVVYDVTEQPEWKDGGHNGYEAGKDLTAELMEKSPHGESKLANLPVVGKLEGKEEK